MKSDVKMVIIQFLVYCNVEVKYNSYPIVYSVTEYCVY